MVAILCIYFSDKHKTFSIFSFLCLQTNLSLWCWMFLRCFVWPIKSDSSVTNLYLFPSLDPWWWLIMLNQICKKKTSFWNFHQASIQSDPNKESKYLLMVENVVDTGWSFDLGFVSCVSVWFLPVSSVRVMLSLAAGHLSQPGQVRPAQQAGSLSSCGSYEWQGRIV